MFSINYPSALVEHYENVIALELTQIGHILFAINDLAYFGVLVLYFARGPAPLSPTIIGKVTTSATSVVLLVIAVTLLVATPWLPSLWIGWSVWCLQLLIATNILYLLYRGVAWAGSKDIANETPSR